MDPAATVRLIDAELLALGDPTRAESEKRYLKSSLTHLGASLPAIRKVASAAVSTAVTHDQLIALATALWDSPIHERRIAAIEVLARRAKLLTPDDLAVAERLIRESLTWGYVDALAVKIAGGLVARHPELAATLDHWSGDDNFWIRRSALLALLPDIRTGHGDLVRLARYGEAMVDEKEFFVRKALGWVLRELSKRDPAWVAAWVADHIDRISGVTIREAVRHLPEPDHSQLLAAYRSR